MATDIIKRTIYSKMDGKLVLHLAVKKKMTGEYLHKKERPSYDGKAILACSVLNKMTKNERYPLASFTSFLRPDNYLMK